MRRLIKTDYLARAEGESGIVIEVKDGEVSKVHMRIFEAPRFFEAFLRGRSPQDVIDFTARICGICPVAYQMSAVHALEKMFGVSVSQPVKDLRRLMYCGEWIESHALHVYLLQGPDFYGLASAWAGKDYLGTAKKGLRFRKLGNDIIAALGGRPVHPVSVRVGGFFRMPDKKTLSSLLPNLERAYIDSVAAINWASSLDFGDANRETEFVSLVNSAEYPMNEGRIKSTNGLDLSIDEFFERIEERQVDYSTALHSGLKREGLVTPYLVGPLSRLNLNYNRLPSEIISAIKDVGVSFPLGNVRMSLLARTIEIAYAFHEAIRIIKNYEKPDRPYEESSLAAGTAAWATEAPRGVLIHRYEIDDSGFVKDCAIIPPTAQNLAHIERDVRDFAVMHIESPSDYLRKETEKIVRSYDPCISCSTHLVTIDDNRP